MTAGDISETGDLDRSPRRPFWEGRVWPVATVLAAALVALPVIAVVVMAATPTGDIWRHLVGTVLPRYLGTSLILVAGVGLGTLILGVGTAWLVTAHRFPGKSVMEWALLLPLSVPAFVSAYVYTDVLEYAGPVQGFLRDLFGWASKRDYWFPEIRSTGGAISVMSLVLYPYVYLLARAAFLEQSAAMLEAARTLGQRPGQVFLRVALPLARPAVIVGLALVSMEVLNDFGTVDFFAVPSFTLGIFDVWLNMNSVGGAAQLALVTLLLVAGLITAERLARRRRRFHNPGGRVRPMRPQRLEGAAAWAALAACFLPILFGFLLPTGLLAADSLTYFGRIADNGFVRAAGHSIGLSALAALLAVVIGTVLAYGQRLHPTRLVRITTMGASLGYAIPGAVLALGVMIPLGAFDNWIAGWAQTLFGVSTGLILSGTVVAVTFGYVARFLALAHGSADAGLAQVTRSMDDAARGLGCTPGEALRRVHVPLLRTSILTAALLVFVDGMKELPMTMMLRPFNFETLATLTHQYASDERFDEATPAALMIVLAGILPVILLSRAIAKGRDQEASEEFRP